MAGIRKTDSDMTQGSIWRHLVEFAIPMALGLLFQQLYNTVDTLVVGNFVSKEAQAAVGSTGSIINTVVGFCTGLATGASVIISQRYGAHDDAALRKAVHTTIAVTFLLSALATAGGLLIVDPMLRFMQTPADVWDDARLYLTIYFWGVSGILFYNMGSGILRAVGDSRRPLLFLMLSALLNTVLDLFFVLVLGMKVDGVALATVLAQVISAAAILFVLTREKAAYGIRWKELRVDRGSLSGILKIGLPSSIQSAITAFSNVFVQSYINAFGSACMAGYSIYNKLDAFVLIPVQALAMSSTTIHPDCDPVLSDNLLQPDLFRSPARHRGRHRANGDHALLLRGVPPDLSVYHQNAERRVCLRGPGLSHGLDSLLHAADHPLPRKPSFQGGKLMKNYLFVHFRESTSPDGEQVHFALSRDGEH